jgi:GDPmannose 4,6-dehydratase
MKKIALITGISGQDGSYLSELLLDKGYIVHGIIRRSSSINTKRLDNIYNNPNLKLHYGDLSDSSLINKIINELRPDEVYNLGAMSHVAVSFQIPEYTCDVDALGTLRILEAIRGVKDKTIKFYQAGTSELYGGIYDKPQNEETPFNPHSPYAVAKLFGYWITKNYRESYNIFAVNGILFNHTSPRRGETFVEKKIVNAAVNIKKGLQECLYLGNIYSYRDYGHAKDFVYAMWLMLQQDATGDYVISSGEKYMIKDIVNMVFSKLDMELEWSGEGINEVAKDINNNRIVVKISQKYFRPLDVESLVGDATLAKTKLGWEPKYTFEDIINEMIEDEMKS